MSNAEKHRKRAVEFEHLKQFDKAIASYMRAIEEAESNGEDVDVALYNKVGDLTLRMGRVSDAVDYYERAVERYASVGLFNNAIALCNKILRNAPGRSAVYLTLGRICAKKGLRGDASRNFLEYASRMRTEDRTEEAMRALAEVADMMPELTEVRGMVEEYAVRAGIELKRRRTPLATAAASSKAHELVFLDVGYDLPEERPRTAAAPEPQVESAPVSTDRHREIVDEPVAPPELASVMIFDPIVQTPPAEDVETPVANGAVSDLTPSGDVDGVVELPMLEVPSADDEEIEGPVVEQQDEIVRGSSLASDDVFGSTSLVADEGIAGLVLGGDYEDPGIAPLDGLTVSEPQELDVVAEALPDLTSRSLEINEEQEPDVMSNLDFVRTAEHEAIPEMVVEHDVGGLETLDDVNAHLPSVESESLIVEPVPELDQAIAEGERTAAVVRLDPHNFILPGELPPLVMSDEVMLRLRARVTGGADAEVDAPESDPADATDEAIAIEESVAPGLASPETAAVAIEEPAAPPLHIVLRDEVSAASDNWALRQRYAEALIEAGEREDGIRELETALTGHANAGDYLTALEVASELVRVGNDRISHHMRRVELAVRLGEPTRLSLSYLDLADVLVREGEDARAQAVYARVLEIDPRNERARLSLGSAAPPLPGAASVEEEQDYVDLHSWLRDDDTSSARLRMKEPEITGDEQADFDALLRHFKEGVSRSLGEDDPDSHYDLGVAYKEMGLLDDAVAEFQKALRSRSHRLPAYEALGQCFVEQGRHQVATTVLSRALHEPGMDDSHRIGVLYLLGYSSEALQRWDDARSYFQRVYTNDPNFRDVAARLAALQVTQ